MARSLTVKFDADTTGVQAGIAKINSALGSIHKTAKSVGNAVKAAMGPLTMIGGAIGGAASLGAKSLIDFGSDLQDLSDTTGISVRNLTVMKEAFERAGMSIEDFQPVLVKLASNLANPSEKTTDAFDKLGLSLEAIKSLSMEDQFKTIGTAIGRLSNQQQKLSVTTAIFGRGSSNLVRLFKDENAFSDAEKYAGGLADKMVRLAPLLEPLGDAIGGLKTKFLEFFATLVTGQDGEEGIKKLTKILNNLDLTPMAKSIKCAFESFTKDINKLGWWEAITKNLSNALADGWDKFKEYIKVDSRDPDKIPKELKTDVGDLIGNPKVGIAGLVSTGYLLERLKVPPLLKERILTALGTFVAGTAIGESIAQHNDGPMVDGKYNTALSPLYGLEESLRLLIGDYYTKTIDDATGVNSYQYMYQDTMARYRDKELEAYFGPSGIYQTKIDKGFSLANIIDKVTGVTSYQAMYQSAMPKDKKPLKDIMFDAYKPVVSSLQRIGGAAGLSGESMPSLQKITNEFLAKIEKNTSGGIHAVATWG